MANRTAKIASSIVAGVLAGAPLVMPRDVANAAECRTEPGKDGSRGQHWYYRLEHGTNRHCWYLRGDDGKAVQTAPADESQASNTATQASNTATATSETPPHSVQDAHAEYPMPQAGANTLAAPAPLAISPLPAQPQADAQDSAVAARWPSPESVIAPAAAAPAVSAAPVITVPAAPAMAAAAPAINAPLTSSTAADATDSSSTADAPTDAASDTSAPADTSVPAPLPAVAPAVPAKPSVSLQMLFAVIGGALALAGLTASVVYRLGRRKERRLATSERRAVLWEGVEPGPKKPWVPPEIEHEPAPAPILNRKAAPNPPVQQQHPVQLQHPVQEQRPVQPQRPVQQQRYEKIEEILAQLVRHGQQSDA